MVNALLQSIDQGRSPQTSFDMSQVATIILGGGEGKRLFPLTQHRCKPAICFGGRYRLIDVPVSMALHSGCNKIFILTQFLSSTLHRHVVQSYRVGDYSSGFIDLLSCEQTSKGYCWYEGTADAVRQHKYVFRDTPCEYFLILSGDQLYKFDFRHFVSHAEQTGADLTIGCIEVDETDASRMGIMKVDGDHNIVDFVEKPKQKEQLQGFSSPYSSSKYLASMGIYLFRRDALLKLINEHPGNDFGMHLIPSKVKHGSTQAYVYDGYWEDIGTISSYYKANLALTKKECPFDILDSTMPVITRRQHLAGSKIYGGNISSSILCDGSIIDAKEISGSIVGQQSLIRKGTTLKDCYIMGNDCLDGRTHKGHHVGIGENVVIENAIIDRNVAIGKNVRLINQNNHVNYDGDGIYVRDGVLVVSRGADIPDGTVF